MQCHININSFFMANSKVIQFKIIVIIFKLIVYNHSKLFDNIVSTKK